MRNIELHAHLVVAVAAFCMLALLTIGDNSLGMKGSYVSPWRIAICIVSAGVSSFLIARVWHYFPAILIAGVLGTVFSGFGPSAVLVGLLVGIGVTSLDEYYRRLTSIWP